ncbi:hypothetical protein B0H17DRAFT_1148442 [Mycena rosella]|uniref:Uncharacterized protein n=1 Tax=Mycena rosella TaxID=1033263 RepID=A0AAD7CDG8_MYCRO|nr:hypothetical protein B0H17DRAFT_1148442 [Mycena rosella]
MSAEESPRPPLQDTTNVPEASTPVTMGAMAAELARLRGVVDVFTTKRGGGRGKKRQCADNENDTTTSSKKSKASASPAEINYIGYGRTIGRFLGPFVNITEVIEYGTSANPAFHPSRL